MEVHFSDEDIYTSQYDLLHDLYQKDCFRDAWEQGVEWFGHHKWPTPRLELLASRILSHLGNLRRSDATILRLWRKHPQLIDLSHHFISVINRRRGPLMALKLFPDVERRSQPNERDQTYLRGEKAEILVRFRDFSAAEEFLFHPDDQENRWILLSQAELKFAQDDYEQAMQLVNELLERESSYRSALQFKANLLQLKNDHVGAIGLLSACWSTSQSFWLGRQLCNLYIENKQFECAHSCLQKLEKLPVAGCRDAEQIVRSLYADLLCAEQRYEEALVYLEQKTFYSKAVVESIKRAPDRSTRKVIDVPFVRQHHMTCAPASLTAVAEYWGVKVEQQDVVDAICYGGTQSVHERKWALENNWFVQEFELTFAALKQLVDHNIPVLLATVEPGSAHLQVIVGYDEAMGTYLLRDPYYRRLQEMVIEGCHKYYASSGPRCMVITPLSMAEHVLAMNLPCRELYDYLYELNIALDNNQREHALTALSRAQVVDPNHRITRSCERAIAFYDNDETRILAATEKLLEQFADDVNFQLSKVSSLSSLGSTKQMLDYLEEIAAQENSHFLIISRLADNLRRDHREQTRVDKLFKQLLNSNPLHADSLYAYAGVLWDKGNFIESYQLYRFVTCLEDKNERYAESFFKAARFHKQTEIGLSFLRDRFARFGKKSSGPAISLFNALDGLDRAHEGLSILDEAIILRPDDGWLMLFTARKFLYYQQPSKAQILVEQARSYVNVVRYHELIAEIHEFNMDTEKSIACLQKVLQIEPLNYNANHVTMRLHIEAGRRAQAEKFIAQQLGLFPDNAMLLRLHISWIDDVDSDALVDAYQTYIDHHPIDAWGYRGLASALRSLDRFDEALVVAKEAIAIENNSSANHACLGDIYLASHRRELARACYRKAVEISSDYTYVYDRLLECGLSNELQQQDLQFIYTQLMAQVSYGDGILEYQKIAWQLLSAEEITGFLQHALEVRSDLWQSWVALALAYRSQGHNEKALELLTAAVQKFPLLPRVVFERAETQRILNDLDAAEKSYRQALELSPNWTIASNQLCELLERQHRLDEAVLLQKIMIQRNPLASTPYGFLADLLIRSGRKDEAIEPLEKALDLDPYYHWAWKTLYDLLVDVGKDRVLKKITKIRKKLPNAGDLALIHAEMLTDPMQVADVLSTFLLRQPHNIDVCVAYIRCLVQQQRFDNAFQYVSDNYWNDQRPNTILANEAWIFAQQGNLTEAIKRMEDLTRINENYYDAWRFLARWYADIKDKDNVLRSVDNCQRIYPNNPSVLCYVAEKLQAIDGDKGRIGNLLQRAFELNPLNQYNGLTYIDYVIEQGDFERAEQALDLLRMHGQDAYTRYREFQIALAKKNCEGGLQIFKSILQDKEANQSLVLNGWKALVDANYAEPTAALIRELRKGGEVVSGTAGRCLALYEFDTQKEGLFERRLLSLTINDEFNHRYIEGYLRGLIKTKRDLPWKIIENFNTVLQKDVENWGLVGYLKVILGRWYEAANWFKHGYPRVDASAWMLYFYALALRESGQWEQSTQVISDAFRKEPDDYRADILVWYSLDQLLQQKPAPLAELKHLDVMGLAGMSRYPLAVVNALIFLEEHSFVDDYLELLPLLRECQTQFQELRDSAAYRQIRRRTRRIMGGSIQQPILRRLYWLWKLANDF